jgi:hypothetical protein
VLLIVHRTSRDPSSTNGRDPQQKGPVWQGPSAFSAAGIVVGDVQRQVWGDAFHRARLVIPHVHGTRRDLLSLAPGLAAAQ